MQEDYGGYAGRLRRLCTEKEKARERSVPDGSDKEVNSLTGPNYGGYAGRLRRLCRKITEVMLGKSQG